MPNRLAKETSSYLLQHQNNPVDWYPWGKEALGRARAENKPILLSVGYSACHWCHVMEHESFEDGEIARLMNENFINIKVDREERPDLDRIYQNVAQAMTQSGGWPLTVFLTPELKPFFGGTYFPPDDRYGRPGFGRVLRALSDAYRNDPEGVGENARRLLDYMEQIEAVPETSKKAPDVESLRSAAEKLLSGFDWTHGGFGSAPKFPNTMGLSFLWRVGTLMDFKEAREAALLALEKMASGGIYDQLGGGFHRYSVDEKWAVPHFEKMLYDNGLLLKLYAEVLLRGGLSVGQSELFTRVLEQTVDYLLREMKSSEGGFYASQDADSEGEEGKYFVWNLADLRNLSEDEARVFVLRYGVNEAGNFEHGKTVLYLATEVPEIASQTGSSVVKVGALLSAASLKLFEMRQKRVAPGTDRKILTAWNGLAISGLTWATQALRRVEKLDVANRAWNGAQGAFRLIQEKLSSSQGRLWSSLQEGQPKGNAYLDDYAFMAMAALDLARWSGDQKQIKAYIEASRSWMATIRARFGDPMGGGFFFTSDDHEQLIQRPKAVFDQAIPSGTAVALACMAVLAEIDGGASVETELSGLFPLIQRSPGGFGELLCTALLVQKGPVVLSGSGEVCEHPHVFQKPGVERMVCHRQTCSLPVRDLDEMRREIGKKLGHPEPVSEPRIGKR